MMARKDKANAKTPANQNASMAGDDAVQNMKKQNQGKKVKQQKTTGVELSKREIRRRRRLRSQMMAYTSLILMIAVVFFFGLWGMKQILNGFKTNSYNINTGIEPGEQANSDIENVDVSVTETPIEVVESEEQIPEIVRDELDDLVDAYLADMSLEDKIAQMFIITPESLTEIPGPATVAGAKTEAALNQIAIGGVLFQSKNFADATKAKEMVSKTYALANRPLFTTVDEAGGKTGTLSSVSSLGFPATSSFSEIGATGDPSGAYEAGTTIGNALASYGFTLNLSAVADLGTDKSFGSDPQLVSDMVSNYVRGVKSANVNVCLTHFPGTSQVNGDPSKANCYTEESLDEMRVTDFIPFKAGIDAGAEFVMVGHISDAQVTGDNTPASMSSIFITDILRNELGFRGIVITDRMDYPAISEYWTTEEATLMAVNAGADIILNPDNYKTAYNALLQAVRDGVISEDRINESLHRIYRVKLAGNQ